MPRFAILISLFLLLAMHNLFCTEQIENEAVANEEDSELVASRECRHNTDHERPNLYDLKRDRQLEYDALFGPRCPHHSQYCNPCQTCEPDQPYNQPYNQPDS